MRAAALSSFATVALAAAVGCTLAIAQPKSSPQAPASIVAPAAGGSPEQVERGRYLTALGDCVACHTRKGGARFAGGRPVETPFGTVLSANLTPDEATGIGRYTPDTFYRALHEGVDRNGHQLYPAFPYNYYTNVSRDDSDAILAFLRTIPAVRQEVDRNQLPFPFNVRAFVGVWNWLFLDTGPLHADPGRSASWNRGAYLVEGLGHCQACHTPRNVLGGPKKAEAFRGGTFGTWFAPDLTPNTRTGLGNWSRETLLEFLRDGLNVHSAAAAEMGEVVAFSTSQMNDADLAAVVEYLTDRPPSPPLQVTRPTDAQLRQGRAIWEDECSACHRMDGAGVPRYFPPLQGDANLQQRDATTVLHYILAGVRRVPTDRAPTPLGMPAFDWKLDDAQIAAVASFARNSWGNEAGAVSADDVAKLRAKLHFGRARSDAAASTTLRRPGPGTLAPADTMSGDNGTAAAGRVAPAGSGDGSAASSSSERSAPRDHGDKGHPGGVPAGGPS